MRARRPKAPVKTQDRKSKPVRQAEQPLSIDGAPARVRLDRPRRAAGGAVSGPVPSLASVSAGGPDYEDLAADRSAARKHRI